MSRKLKSRPAVHPHAVDKPPLTEKPLPPKTMKQSPQPKGAEIHAQQLVHEVGSPDRAKQVIDTVAERESLPDFRENHFARHWGFRSQQALLNASRPVIALDGTSWWATEINSNRWIVWNQDSMSADATFASREEAMRSLMTPPVHAAVAAHSANSPDFGEFPEAYNG